MLHITSLRLDLFKGTEIFPGKDDHIIKALEDIQAEFYDKSDPAAQIIKVAIKLEETPVKLEETPVEIEENPVKLEETPVSAKDSPAKAKEAPAKKGK